MNGSNVEVKTEKPPLKQCKFYVTHKKRNCRILVKHDEDFCGEHQPIRDIHNEEIDAKRRRIVCPLDNKHTCYADKLKKHLKVCNAKQKVNLPYIQKGINIGSKTSEDKYRCLSTFSNEEIKTLVSKINKIYEEKLREKITEKILTHHVVEGEILEPEFGHAYGPKRLKHLKQASSILGLLNEYKLIKPNTCFIEFGAGRGQLTYWLNLAANDPNSTYLLIERSSPKHKKDNKLSYNEDNVHRIRADIGDLVLDNLDDVEKAENVVGVTKHLCGQATDLALYCLANANKNRKKMKGCLMTFCCHHACCWGAYTGKEWFKEVNLNKDEFDMMCGMSSWAVCGNGFSRERQNEEKIDSEKTNELGLTKREKEEIGRRVKSIINCGRLHFLEKLGFKGNLHYYVDESISLENVCLVAYT